MTEITVNSQFARFGKYCFLLAIFMILAIIPVVGYFAVIAQFAMVIRIYIVAKRIQKQLNSENIRIFYSKFLISYLLFGVLEVVLILMNIFLNVLAAPSGEPEAVASALIFLLVYLGIIVVFMIIIGLLQMKAWENLNIFFTENRNMFPEIIIVSALDGTKKLRLAGKLTMIVITFIIAYILSIIGFFKLGKLRRVGDVSGEFPMAAPPPEPVVSAAPETPEKEEPEPAKDLQFCGNCGTKLDPSWSVCPECGSPVGEEGTYQPPPVQQYPQEVKAKVSKTFGSLALAFGIISLCCCCGFIFGPLAILFGMLGLFKDDDRSLSIVGLVFGIIGSVCGFIFLFWFLGSALFIGPSN
ncbi:MAG: hypothetical protein KGD74_03910 [Candidatus Lokiarchaeota archaeon]|nr:hypothetical protein [Candidatus Lokiarchaeota archaeon]